MPVSLRNSNLLYLQSINVVENQQLRAIFLMLRAELKDSDIPHRTKIRKRIIETWDEHLNTLQREMAVCCSCFFLSTFAACFMTHL